MTTMIQPAMAMPQQGYMPMQGQGWGPGPMPQGMAMAQAPMMAGPAIQQQPVYFSSMSQLPPGVVPVSQQLASQAIGQSQAGADVVQPASPLRSMLAGAALGAVGGFGASLLLPFGPFVGAIAGAAIGGAAGLVVGIRKRRAQEQFHTMRQPDAQAVAQGQAQMVGAAPDGARKGVVMGPEMRKRWAAKVRAERAAAAAAGGR